MTRQTLSLDGTWQFQLDPTNSISLKTLKPTQKVNVPAPWQTRDGLHDYSGVAWHLRSRAPNPKSSRLLLRMACADWVTTWWLRWTRPTSSSPAT